MRLIRTLAWALVVLSAFLQVSIFPVAGPLPFWRAALGWISLSPLFLALLLRDRRGAPLTPRRAAMLGYACGFLWYLGSCYWIEQTMHLYGGLPEPVAVVILVFFSLYLGLYHALFSYLLVWIRSAAGPRTALLSAPFVWVAVELARARVTGFPWDLLGYSQIDNELLTRLAPLAGVMALSFAIAAVNAGISFAWVGKGRSRWIVPAIAFALAVLLQAGNSMVNPSKMPATQMAVMMQENLAVGAASREVEALSLPEELSLFTDASRHPQVAGRVSGASAWSDMLQAPKPTVVIWPEAPSHFFTIDPLFLGSIATVAQTAGAPVIAGAVGLERDPAGERGYFRYDSAALFDASGYYRGHYDKIHLVPWGEYVPYKQFFGFAKKLTEGVGDMDRGHERTVFSTGGHRYGVFVCYESIFGDEVREFAKNGAEVLVNISDDGWYGDSGAPWQHLNMARMRAIENHRWVLRSTNTGVTTAIDPGGRTEIQAPRHVRAAFAFPFNFERGTTFYTRHGDWFAYLCAVVTLCVLGFSVVRRAGTGNGFALK